MPTGYTADVATGEVTEFRKFAMQCARAFGATVTMRDAPASEEIPERFEPSDYHKEKMLAARKETERLGGLTPDQVVAERNAAEMDRQKEKRDWGKKNEAQRQRYLAMIAKAEAWEPPTEDHTAMKKFMLEQLRESLDFDCGHSYWNSDPTAEPSIWLREQIAKSIRDESYHAAEYAKEVKSAAERTAWVAALRNSLNPPA